MRDSELKYHRHVIITKLIAVLSFMIGAIICHVIGEKDLGKFLIGGTTTGFASLFTGGPTPPFKKDDNDNPNPHSRVPGSDVKEVVNKRIIKG